MKKMYTKVDGKYTLIILTREMPDYECMKAYEVIRFYPHDYINQEVKSKLLDEVKADAEKEGVVLRWYVKSKIPSVIEERWITWTPEVLRKKMTAEKLKCCMKEYLTTNFGTSDEPSYPSIKNLKQLVYEIEQDVENGIISEPI